MTARNLSHLRGCLPRAPRPKQAACSPAHHPHLLRTASSSPSPPACALSPLDEFLEHVPSEVLTDLFDVRLREEAGVGDGARPGADQAP